MASATGKNRPPDWSAAEDAILADTVLNKLRLGETQLKAFEEASVKLPGRTAAACGFRWNKVVRKTVKESIEAARAKKRNAAVSVMPDSGGEQTEGVAPTKMTRNRNSRKVSDLDMLEQLFSPDRIKDMADFINTLSANLSGFHQVRTVLEEKEREINELKEANTNLLARVKKLEKFEREFNVLAERVKKIG